MNKSVRLGSVVAVALTMGCLSASLSADERKSLTNQDIVTAVAVAEILFGEDERKVFAEYGKEVSQGDHHSKKKKKSLPPGLKKKLARGGELPPGWQKKVARGEVLDAEVHRQSYRLPAEILRRLPTQPKDTSLIRVEDRIVRVVTDTLVILDVFDLL